MIGVIFTSRFANHELLTGEYTAVRISLGSPKWRIGYEIAGCIPDLMPKGIFGIRDRDEFQRQYYERLDSVGVGRIREQLQFFEKFGKPVVLLCFEDIRKGGGNWCHRNMFASWWRQRTGEVIHELKDESSPKTKTPHVNAESPAQITFLSALMTS